MEPVCDMKRMAKGLLNPMCPMARLVPKVFEHLMAIPIQIDPQKCSSSTLQTSRIHPCVSCISRGGGLPINAPGWLFTYHTQQLPACCSIGGQLPLGPQGLLNSKCLCLKATVMWGTWTLNGQNQVTGSFSLRGCNCCHHLNRIQPNLASWCRCNYILFVLTVLKQSLFSQKQYI